MKELVRVTEAWEGVEIHVENAMDFEPHAFCIFCVLARLAAFVNVSLA